MLPDDNFLPGEVLVQQPGLAEDPGQAGHQWVHHTFAHFLIFLYFLNLKIYLYFMSGVHIKRYSNFYSFNLLVLGIKEKTENCKEIEVWGADHGL